MPATIAPLINQLRVADPKRYVWGKGWRRRVFGAGSHNYQLRPTLSEATLRAFEAKHDVQLPADYRAFLREIGDGGVGPYYGLETLENVAKFRDLSRPFPLTQAFTLTDLSDEAIDAMGDEEEPGLLELCHHGCAIYNYLVVRGPAYGTIWHGENGEFYPTQLSFGDWYQQWAQRALRLLGNQKLGNRIRRGMSVAEVSQATGAQWNERASTYQPKIYLSCADIPVQIEMNLQRVVISVKPWHSI